MISTKWQQIDKMLKLSFLCRFVAHFRGIKIEKAEQAEVLWLQRYTGYSEIGAFLGIWTMHFWAHSNGSEWSDNFY